MRKNHILLLGLIIFLATTVVIIYLTWGEKQPLFYFLYLINIASALSAGQYFYNERGIYHWKWLKEKQVFEIISVGADFEHPITSKLFGKVVADVEGFGDTLLKLPTNPKLWKGHVPKRGEKFIVMNEQYHLIN